MDAAPNTGPAAAADPRHDAPGTPVPTFMAAVLAGTCDLDDIDDFVDRWHEAPGEGSLADFLGLSQSECDLWAKHPEELATIVDAHRPPTSGDAAAGEDTDHPGETVPLPEPHTEWAVEVTWRDWRKAGAKGPTSQYGPFLTPEHRDRFLDTQRRDRDVAATRVLTRLAAYTDWGSTAQPDPTSEADRNQRLERFYAEVMGQRVGRDGMADAD